MAVGGLYGYVPVTDGDVGCRASYVAYVHVATS